MNSTTISLTSNNEKRHIFLYVNRRVYDCNGFTYQNLYEIKIIITSHSLIFHNSVFDFPANAISLFQLEHHETRLIRSKYYS